METSHTEKSSELRVSGWIPLISYQAAVTRRLCKSIERSDNFSILFYFSVWLVSSISETAVGARQQDL
jgi:hypothetical protein